MKRLLSMVLCAILLVSMLAVTANAEGIKYVFTQNGKTLNLRDTPNGNRIAMIPFGAQVYEELMVGVPDGWSCVTYNGLRGFVMNRYLVDSPRPAPVNPGGGGSSSAEPVDIGSLFKSFKQVTPYSVIAAPKGSYVNLRWAPSKSAAVMERLVYGVQLTVIAEGRSWLQVCKNDTGAVGFIDKNFVK